MKKHTVSFSFLILLTITLSLSLEGQSCCCKDNRETLMSAGCPKKPLDYKVWKTGKSEDDEGPIYISFVSLDEEIFNQNCVCELGKLLNEHFEKNRRIKVFLFDNAVITKSFSEGKFHPQDLSSLIRGMYFLDRNKSNEYIKFSSKKGNSWDEMTIRINQTCKNP